MQPGRDEIKQAAELLRAPKFLFKPIDHLLKSAF
jgi:hypothetical protein